jgi:phage shock protein B
LKKRAQETFRLRDQGVGGSQRHFKRKTDMDPGSFAIMIDGIEQLADVVFGVSFVVSVMLCIVWVVKIRSGSRLSKADEATLMNVNLQLRIMEQRMASLEKILDAEVPAWRAGFEETGVSYGQKAG